MLKLTYTENSFRLEYLKKSLEKWVTNRLLLSLRSGTSLAIEPSTASFLLETSLSSFVQFKNLIDKEEQSIIELTPYEDNFVEVILQGTWLGANSGSSDGIFVTCLSEPLEQSLYQLCQQAEIEVSI